MTAYSSVFRGGLFSGKLCIVTGGGSGIGRCTAIELASLGAEVALVGRKEDKLRAVQAELAALGAKAHVHSTSATKAPYATRWPRSWEPTGPCTRS